MNLYKEKNKLVIKNTFALYFRMLLTMGVTLYTSRVILEALGMENYGIYNVIAGVVVMIDFINSALYGSSIRFLTYIMESNDMEARKQIFSSIRLVHLFISIVTIIMGETIGLWFVCNKLVISPDRIESAIWTYEVTLAMLVFCEINLPYTALIMAYERMNAFAYISMLEVSLKLGISFLVLYISFDKLISYALLLLIVQILLQLIYIFYCKKHFAESSVPIRFYKNSVMKIGKFTGWSVLGSISSVISTQGVNILLNIFFGPIVNAARGISAQVQVAIVKFSSNFQVAIKPQMIKSYSMHEYERAHQLFLYSSKLSLYLSLVIITPIYYFTPAILRIWLSDFPEYTVPFIRIILIQQIVFSLSYPLITMIEANGNIKQFQICIGIISLSTLPLAYLALTFFYITPVTVMLVYLTVESVAYLIRVYIVLPVISLPTLSYLQNVIFPAIIPVGLITIAYFLLPISSVYSVCKIALYSMLVCASIIFVIYWSGINNRDRVIINKYAKQIICKIFIHK